MPQECGDRSATAVAGFVNGSALYATVTDGGRGYTTTPAVWILGGGGTSATRDAFLFNGVVMYIGITTEGTGNTNPPSIFIARLIGRNRCRWLLGTLVEP